MNIYISLRVIFHSLLVVNNLLALTVAAWTISVSGGKASPGAVLIILGCVAFVLLSMVTWAEVCSPGTSLSRVRLELALVPMLIVFQLVGAAITTSNTVQSVCLDPASCIALLVLAWLTPFSLIVYYLMVLVVTFDHATNDSNIWDASFLEHPWFLRPPPPPQPPPKETVMSQQRLSMSTVSTPPSLRTHPSLADHSRQRPSWAPSTVRAPPPSEKFPASSPPRGSVMSLSMPKWARDLRPLRRALELPFPVQTRGQDRTSEDPRRIDAPVSPMMYTEAL